MTYRIQIFYPDAGFFINTNHESDNLDDLKRVASSEIFRGFRIRVVDALEVVLFEPPVQEAHGAPSLLGIASALGVPIIDSPEGLLGRGEGEDPAKSEIASGPKKSRQGRFVKAACCLEAHHRLPDAYANEPLDLDSPEGLARLKESSDQIYQAQIAFFRLSETQAQKIVDRLWPGQSLLGATCGQGFSITTADQIAVINEVLAPDIAICFKPDKHVWMLQTWPERADPD